MKIWLSSDGKSTGGKKYFATVQEFMIDKDGKHVYVPTPTPVEEPTPVVAPAVAEPEVVVEPTPVVAPAPAPVVVVERAESDPAVINLLTEVVGKCDSIIDLLAKDVAEPAPATVVVVEAAPEVVEEAVEEPAPEIVEEAVEEPAPEVVEEAVEEPAPEVVEEAVEEPAEDVAVTVIEMDSCKEDIDFLLSCIDTPAEEPAPVPEAVVEEVKAPAPRSRSFAEKMRDASEILQDRYDELKNYALRFRKLKSRISRKFDSINQGRFQFVKLGVAGKSLKLYLNMDVKTTDPKFHCKDMSDKKTYVTVPTMLRIKSGRAVKYAKILIDQCAEQHGMLERRKPFVVDAMALIDEALAGKEAPETEVETGEGEE